MAFACASTARPVLPDYSLDRGRVVAALQTLKAGREGFSEATCADAIAAWLARGDTAWQACLIGDGGLDLEGRRLSSLFGGASAPLPRNEGSSVGVTGSGSKRRGRWRNAGELHALERVARRKGGEPEDIPGKGRIGFGDREGPAGLDEGRHRPAGARKTAPIRSASRRSLRRPFGAR